MHTKKHGVLLVQLGTPDSPSKNAVGQFLKAFLSDPKVVNLPTTWRYLLVHGLIVPFRRGQSAKAYEAIWTEAGSPLRVHSEELCHKVREAQADHTPIQLAMRYGEPSIAQGLRQLLDEDCEHITVLPLFPQFADATTGSVNKAVQDFFDTQTIAPSLTFINDFYDHPAFVNAWAQRIQPFLEGQAVDHIIYSYHGLPVKQVQAAERGKVDCNHCDACPVIHTQNRFCYRAQCYATTHAIATKLQAHCPHSVAFQSRLGRIPWIQPYFDEHLKQCLDKGVRHLLIVCPAFVADCLETLEEIGIRAKNDWLAMGGASLRLVPSLNATEPWVDAVRKLVAPVNLL